MVRLSSGARCWPVALLLALAVALPAAAGDEWLFDPDERLEQLDPPPSLPEGLRGTILRQDDAAPVRRVDTIRDVFRAIQACWRMPAGSGFSGQEITVRLSFKRSGELLGKPRITYYKPGTEADRREPFANSVREAFDRCTPLPVTEGLGRALAGRIFSIRFVDSRPM
jgi:hypothetical protein